MTDQQPAATDETAIIAYAHNLCPMWVPVKGMLDRTGADYTYINIHEDDAARQRVREINNGYESVPTLIFPDGSTLTEPSTPELRGALQRMGYNVPLSAIVMGYAGWIVLGVAFLLALLRGLGVF